MIFENYMHGVDVLGASEYIGAFDTALETKKLDALKQVTVGIARILLRGGQAAIESAKKFAKQPWYKPNLPGEAARDNVAWKLVWHAGELAKYTSATEMYPHAADLKKWVTAAFVESNAAEEGSATVQKLWSDMWVEINQNIAALPAAVAKKVGEAAEGLTTVAKVAIGVGVGLAALTGFVAYKIVQGPVGQTVAREAVRRYLP